MIDSIILGIFISSVYGLAVTGLNIIAGVMRVLNMAHPDFLTLGAYIAYWLWVFLNFNPLMSVPLSLVTGLLVGIVFYHILFKKLLFSMDAALMGTFAFGITLEESMKILWTPNYVGIRWSLGAVIFFGITLPITYLIVFIANLIIILVAYLIILKTNFGRAFRAVMMDRDAAALCGVKVESITALGFAFGTILAFIGGTLLIVYCPAGINPYMGGNLLAKSLVIATIGGLGNLWGALIGGLIVGVSEQVFPSIIIRFFPNFLAAPLTQFIYFIMFLIIIIVKPSGILG